MNFDLDDLAPERDHQHVSLGSLCGLLQCLPGQLGVLMRDAEIKFSLVLDGVGYVRVADAERLAEKCRDVRQEIDDATNKAERFAAN